MPQVFMSIHLLKHYIYWPNLLVYSFAILHNPKIQFGLPKPISLLVCVLGDSAFVYEVRSHINKLITIAST